MTRPWKLITPEQRTAGWFERAGEQFIRHEYHVIAQTMDLNYIVYDPQLPQPLDPHDEHVNPERTARVSVGVNERERQERRADDALSDFGSAALHRRYRRDED
jgi:hypothetical protein